MATELLPVVDLRALSRSDLDALAAASAHALSPRSRPDADPLPPLKIDRAVFNESAGSRKQTFSRLRLAAASASSPTAGPTSPTPAPKPSSARKDPDSDVVVVANHLRRLFVPDDPSLPPPPERQTLVLTEPSPSPPRSRPPDPDLDITNPKGIPVDLVRLAGMVDPYCAELRTRTSGLASETELMGFIASLAGKWASQRQRRKFVDASFFGDHLPSGWKLLLGLKRKERTTQVHCFSYVSPKGSKFATCKEVSAYLMSLLGYPAANTVTAQYNSTGKSDSCADNGHNEVTGFQLQIGSSVCNPNILPVTSVTVSSYSGDLKDNDQRNVDTLNAYECQKCNLTFQDQISYSQHNLSDHEVTAKRRRTGKFGDPVVGKDGNFECPVCHKTFSEESRYFGHVGAHARYEGLTPGAFLDKVTSGKVHSSSLEETSFSLQEFEHGGEAGYHHLSGSNEHGSNGPKVKDFFNANCLDGFNRTNEAWHRTEEISRIAYETSACNVAVPKVSSNSNGQPDGSHNGSGVTVYKDQASSHHVFRPNSFGCGNPYEAQIVDHGMASKRGEVSNTVKARNVNLNSCLGTSYVPIASANNETSTALNEACQSTFAAQCFSGSFSNNGGVSVTSSCSASTTKRGISLDVAHKTSFAASPSFSASNGNNIVGGKANLIGKQNNTVVYQSNMGIRPVSYMETGAGYFASHSVHPENSDKKRASSTMERMDNMRNTACKDTGFDMEAYSNNNVGGFTQFSSSFAKIKPNVSIHCSLPDSNTLKARNLTKGTDVNLMNESLVNRSDVNCMRGSFVNRHISNNESNVSMHELMGKSRDEMQNCNDHVPGRVLHAPVSAGQNGNGPMSTQANVGGRSYMVRSVGDAPVSNTTQDQCDLQLGFGVQKEQIYSGYGELRSTTSESVQPGFPRNNSLSTGPSQFGSMARPNSFPSESSQFGSLAKPDVVPTSFQFGIMARPNSVPPAESSQFGNISRSNFIPHTKSTQCGFGSTARSPNSSQFESLPRPNCILPSDSSQFGSMVRPNNVPHAKFSQFGSMDRPNYALPANSSQLGSTARSSSFPPAEASEFRDMTRQNFVSRTEPTLVLGYAPQMGNGPPVQVGWNLPSPKVTGDMMTCVCIWCNSQFHHFGPADGQQAGSFGFICPACKEKITGHPNMRGGGSWQP